MEIKWNTIEELRNLLIEPYLNPKEPLRLGQACSTEVDDKTGYNGRQILELLQNVDDACDDHTGKEVSVKIVFKDNILEVGNTGTVFTAESMYRLCYGGVSQKSLEKIGNKGRGFRSLLNDSEWIEIHSGEFSVRFSEEYAKELFNQYCTEGSAKYSAVVGDAKNSWNKDYPLCFPVMSCPQEIEKTSGSFDTLVRVKIKEENIKKKGVSIVEQLDQPFYKALLFLPNITEIIVVSESGCKHYKKGKAVNGDVVIECDRQKELFFVDKKNVKIRDKSADLIIAIPRDANYDFSNEKLYCYFPIRNFSTPIHALLHAPFITNNYRDDVPNDSDEVNRKIFEELLDFAKETVEKIEDSADNTLKIKTLTWFPENKLWKTDSFNLKKKYFDCILESKILPTVNGGYISIKDKPKWFVSSFPEEFIGKEFEDLIISLDLNIIKFIEELASYDGYREYQYCEKDLSEKISRLVETKDDVTRDVKLFLWWSETFKSSFYFPSFIKDDKNKWIDRKSTVYLPGGISNLPQELSWVQLCILNSAYKSEIIRQIKEEKKDVWEKVASNYKDPDDNRILGAYSEKYLALKFVEQSSYAQMIRTINQQIKTVEQSKTFVNWFFDNFDKELKEGSELSSRIPYNVPDRELKIRNIKELYLGADYDNAIAEKLFENTAFQPIVDLKSIYDGKDKERFIDFLMRCGVKKFPEIVSTGNIVGNSDFKGFILKKYEKDLLGLNLNTRTAIVDSKTIKNFEMLISDLPTEEIVRWLTSDEKIKTLITSQEKRSSAYQQSNWAPKPFPSNAYIRYVLNNTPWIELDGQKYSPNQIVKYDKLGNLLPGFYGISEQKLVSLLGKDIVYLFNLDFKDSLAQFTDNEIRKILDVLPEMDKNGFVSKKLYQDIINEKIGISPTYSLNGIKVFTKKGNFCLNADVKYADRKTTRQEESQNNFIYVSPKQSTETIRNWFGVERYKTNLVLKSHEIISSKQFNEIFESEINDVKTAVLSSIDANPSNVSILKNLSVIPCSKVCVKDGDKDGEETTLEDFYFVENEKKYYLKLPVNVEIDELRASNPFRSIIVDIFKQSLTLKLEEDLVELLISMERGLKCEKIEEKFGFGKWAESEELLFQKKVLNEQVESFFKDNGLSLEFFEKISKINFLGKINLENQKTLIESLKSIGKDVADLNSLDMGLDIDIKPYWINLLKESIDSKSEQYVSRLYDSAKEYKDKANFLNNLIKFKEFVCNVENSIYFDVNKVLEGTFPLLKEGMGLKSSKEIDELYEKHFKQVICEHSISKDDLEDYVNKNEDVHSLLYFEIPEDIDEKIKEYLKKDQEKSLEPVPPDEGDTGTTVVILDPPDSPDPGPRPPTPPKTKKDYKRKNENSDKKGKTAERIAYKELKKTYDKLIWHSENSDISADKVRSKYPPNGIVCDMWNCDPVHGNMYFEVKSESNDFEMTSNEYDSMAENKDNYIVILANTDTRKISHHKFDEIEKLKRPSAYVFKFKKRVE